MVEQAGFSAMSRRLSRPENRLTLENLLTPVRKLKRIWASRDLIVEYTSRKQLRLTRAMSGSSSASRIGLSH